MMLYNQNENVVLDANATNPNQVPKINKPRWNDESMMLYNQKRKRSSRCKRGVSESSTKNKQTKKKGRKNNAVQPKRKRSSRCKRGESESSTKNKQTNKERRKHDAVQPKRKRSSRCKRGE